MNTNNINIADFVNTTIAIAQSIKDKYTKLDAKLTELNRQYNTDFKLAFCNKNNHVIYIAHRDFNSDDNCDFGYYYEDGHCYISYIYFNARTIASALPCNELIRQYNINYVVVYDTNDETIITTLEF